MNRVFDESQQNAADVVKTSPCKATTLSPRTVSRRTRSGNTTGTGPDPGAEGRRAQLPEDRNIPNREFVEPAQSLGAPLIMAPTPQIDCSIAPPGVPQGAVCDTA